MTTRYAVHDGVDVQVQLRRIEVADAAPAMPMGFGMPGMETQMQGLQDLFKAFGGRSTRKRMTVAQSYEILIGQEADKLLDARLKARAARVPGCVLEASQCSVSEALALTRQVQTLRDRLGA